MPTKKFRRLAAAVGTAALFAASGASADLVYLPADNALFQGSGLGAVNTLLTLTSPGSSSTESGAVFAVGAGLDVNGDALKGTSQYGLPSLGALGITSASNLRLILNATEPAGNSITVNQLMLSFYDSLGASLASFTLAGPVVIASTFTGIGQAGFAFGLDAAQAATASSLLGASGTPFADVRVELAATLTDATGGPDTFFVGNAAQVAAIPEPSTYLLMFAGLACIGFTVRRRMS